MSEQRKTSQARIDANRRNAQKSTGPRTPEGKERSKRNHTSHGFFCANLVLPGEDFWCFEYLREHLIDDYRPQNHAELLVVDRIVIASWKLSRLQRAERRMQDCIEERRKDWAKCYNEFYETRCNAFAGDKKITPSPQMKEMASFSRKLLEEDHGERGDIAVSLVVDLLQGGGGGRNGDGFDRLHRYEMRLENSIYRAGNELRKMRKGKWDDDEELPESPYSKKALNTLEQRYAAHCDRMEKLTGRRPPPFEEIDRPLEGEGGDPTDQPPDTYDAPDIREGDDEVTEADEADEAVGPEEASVDAPPRSDERWKMRNEPNGAFGRAPDDASKPSEPCRDDSPPTGGPAAPPNPER